MNDTVKKAFQGMGEEEQARQDAEYVKKLRSLVGMGPKPGTEIPQQPIPQDPNARDIRTRSAITSDKPMVNPMGMNQALRNVDVADNANQMKQLKDLEDVGAFEAPDSEVNVRAANLRRLLGK